MPSRTRPRRALLALVLALVATSVITVDAQAASSSVTSLTSEGFSGRTTVENSWSLPPAAAQKANGACLTAGTDTSQTPIRACRARAVDTGTGTLRLTSNDVNVVGTVYSTTSLPTTQGLDVRFATYQWASAHPPGADGIGFVLAATDPANPAPPALTGPVGGSLGYSAAAARGVTPATAGVTDGYLGFGLDVYGNYRSSAYGGTGCAASTSAPQNVTVRGPGNGLAGYCIAGTQQVTAGTLDARTATARPAAVPVEIALNPASSATTSLGGATVPGRSWMLTWTPVGGSPQWMTGALPTAAALAGFGFPASYYDPVTGLPYQLTFGWSASTGGYDEIHEINNLTSSTLNGALPDLDLAVGDDQGAALLAGSTANVSVTPSLDAGQGPENRVPTVTTTFPTGLTPINPTTTDYACSTTGQVVRCTYPTIPVAAGQALPTLTIPVQVGTAPASGLTIVVKASSTDANPAQATRTVSVVGFGARATPARVAYGTPATLSATGLPAAATGTVVFTTSGAPLCTATLPDVSCPAPATLVPGTYPVTATYSGDAGFATRTALTSLEVTRLTPGLSAGVSDAQVPYGTADVLTFSGLPGAATGSVVFTSRGTTLCTVEDVTAATGCPTPDRLDVATYPVTATYSGDPRFAPTTASTTFTVAKAAVDLQAAASQDTVAYGTGDTLSVGGLPADATGSVRFTAADGSVLCTIDDVAATTSCAVPSDTDADAYAVTAAYAGDAHHAGARATTAFTVVPADTAVVAAVSDPSVPFGTSSAVSFGGLPAAVTGTVVLTADGDPLCTVDVTEATSCPSPTDLGAGSHVVTATYSGDRNHHGSSAQTRLTVTAQGSPRFTAAAADPAPSYGTPDTLAFSGLADGATGSVRFTAGGRTLCEVADVRAASSCPTDDDLDAGAYEVTATYSGDRNHAAASASADFRVVPVDTAVAAGVADPSVPYGVAPTLAYGGLPAAATGSVTFTAGGRTLCTVADVRQETSCTSDVLAPGSYAVTVTYSGDDNHRGSSDRTRFVVERAAVELTAGVSDAEVPWGTADTLGVGGVPAGAGGTVTFTAGGRVLCAVDDVLASLSCPTPADLAVGTYAVTATYSGDGDHAPATATTAFAVVRVATGLSASVGRTAVPWGTGETFAFGGLPTGATGSVTFASGDAVLCTVADVTAATGCGGGTDLATGDHPVTATYSGDARFAGSRATTRFTVVRAEPSFSASAASGAVAYGTADTLTFSSLPPAATGRVTFTSGARTLCTVEDITATDRCATPDDLPAGTYPVVATYGGDDRFVGVTAATGFSVTPAPTPLTASVSLPDVHWGQDDTFRFDGLPAGATGRVTFTVGDVVLCTVEPAEAPSGSCAATVKLPVGPHEVTATYAGDANHAPATATTAVNVFTAATSLSASVDRAEVPWGTSETFRFGALSDGATGSVTFEVEGRVVCTVDAVVAPSGSCAATVDLPVGPHEVIATYSGDANHDAAEATTTFAVVRAPVTGFTAAVDRPRTPYGTPVALSFAGLPDGATGTVRFTVDDGAATARADEQLLCSVVVGEAVSCATPASLEAGDYAVLATYSGDGTHEPATARVTFTVVAAEDTGEGNGNGDGGGSGGDGSGGDGSAGDGSTGSGHVSSLAATGGPGALTLVGGLLLLGAGAALVTSRRRRPRC